MNFFEKFTDTAVWIWLTENISWLSSFSLIFEILGIASMWVIFNKAGRFGIGSIIPIYKQIVLLQISGLSGWLVLLYLIPIVNIFVSIILAYNLSKSFNKGMFCTLGLIFFRPVALMYLAFGGSRYH